MYTSDKIRKTKATYKRKFAFLLAVVMVLQLIAPMTAFAAKKKKTKLNTTRITCTVGQKKTLKLLNNTKKVTWSTSSKKIVQIKKKSKNTVILSAKKKGTATITAKVGKTKYKCKVTVKKADSTKTTTEATTTEAATETNTTTETVTTTETTEAATSEQVKQKWKVLLEKQAEIVEEAESKVNWDLSEDGILTIECTGDFNTLHPEWEAKKDEVTQIQMKGTGITSLRGLFQNYKNLQNVDFTGLDTSLVTNMSRLFYGCRSLKTINFGETFQTENVTDMSGMFYECNKLEAIDVSQWNTGKVTDFSNMFLNCSNRLFSTLDVSNWNTGSAVDMSGMFQGCNGLSVLNVSKFDTSHVTNMARMFYNCKLVTELDVSSFDTSKVTDMSYMFAVCNRATVNGISNWNTSNVTDMSYMFWDYRKQAVLDLSNFDTSKVTDMSYMFKSCAATSINLSSFDTSNVTDMSYMFDRAVKVSELDLSGFDTSKVTNMSYMLSNLGSVVVLNLDKLSMEQVEDTSYMFYNDYRLKELKLADTRTDRALNMEKMFAYCMQLQTLSIPVFTNNDSKNMSDMFVGCPEAIIPEWYSMQEGKQEELTEIKIMSTGTIQEGITWSLDSNQVLTIEGTGCIGLAETEMNWKTCNLPYTAITVKIEEGITGVETHFFDGYEGVKAIILPETIERLEEASLAMPNLVKAEILSDHVVYGNDVFGGISGQMVIWCHQGQETETETILSSSEQYAKDNQIPYAYIDKKDGKWASSTLAVQNYTGNPVLPELPPMYEKVNGEMTNVTELIDHVYYSDETINRDNYYTCSETMPTRTAPGRSQIYYYAIISGYKTVTGELIIDIKADLNTRLEEVPYGDMVMPEVSAYTTLYYSTSRFLQWGNYKKYGQTVLPQFSKPGKYRIYCIAVPSQGATEATCESGYMDVIVQKEVPQVELKESQLELALGDALTIHHNAAGVVVYQSDNQEVLKIQDGKPVVAGIGEAILEMIMKESDSQQEKKVSIKIKVTQ